MTRAAGIFLAAAGVAAICAGCRKPKESEPMTSTHIDREWFRHSLIDDNLAHWLAAGPTESGFFRTDLDRQWRPAARQVATLVSQSRMIFVMAAGHDATGEEAYLQAVSKGGDFLVANFRDAEHGGWLWQVSTEGKVLDDGKNSYGHAFVIFGLAHAHRVTGEKRFARAALSCWNDMKAHLRYDGGGIKPRTDRAFTRIRGTNTQNPMMHLFEALLALHEATGSKEVLDDAGELAGFIYGRLYQAEGGYLPEMYDKDWKPLPVADGGYVDLGHQFEWAFLLSQGVEQGLPARYLDIAKGLLDYGMKVAYDREAGGIASAGDYDGKVIRPDKGWWQQCELLRALMRHASAHGRDGLWPAFAQSLEFAKAEFMDAEYGGWYGSATGGKTPPRRQARKGSNWKTGYHAVGMYREALRLTGGQR